MTSKKPHPLPPAAIAGITCVAMLIVIAMAWQKSLNRPDLRGTWETACQSIQSGIGLRASSKNRLQLTKNEWILSQSFYSDPECNKEAYVLETRGAYELGDASKEVAGAMHLEFIVKKTNLTASSPETAQFFEQAGCANAQWEPGQTVQIDDKNCPIIDRGTNICSHVYDLVKRDGNSLYLADPRLRSCERNDWPNALDPKPYIKMN